MQREIDSYKKALDNLEIKTSIQEETLKKEKQRYAALMKQKEESQVESEAEVERLENELRFSNNECEQAQSAVAKLLNDQKRAQRKIETLSGEKLKLHTACELLKQRNTQLVADNEKLEKQLFGDLPIISRNLNQEDDAENGNGDNLYVPVETKPNAHERNGPKPSFSRGATAQSPSNDVNLADMNKQKGETSNSPRYGVNREAEISQQSKSVDELTKPGVGSNKTRRRREQRKRQIERKLEEQNATNTSN